MVGAMPSGVVVMVVSGDDSGRDRRRWQEAVDDARDSIEMEGGRVSDAVEEDAARYIAGELSTEEMLERVRRLYVGGSAASMGG